MEAGSALPRSRCPGASQQRLGVRFRHHLSLLAAARGRECIYLAHKDPSSLAEGAGRCWGGARWQGLREAEGRGEAGGRALALYSRQHTDGFYILLQQESSPLG